MNSNWTKKYMKEVALYWAPPCRDGYGNYEWGSPLQVSCKWEIKRELTYDSNGAQVFSKGVVYLIDDLLLGGFLWKGSFNDLLPVGQHTRANDAPPCFGGESDYLVSQECAVQIIDLNIVKSLKSHVFLYKVLVK